MADREGPQAPVPGERSPQAPPGERSPQAPPAPPLFGLRLRAGTRSLLLPGLLGGAAVATGGMAGVLLGFLAALLGIDRLLDRVIGRTGAGMFEAERRFLALERQRRRDALKRRLRLRGADAGEQQLAYLADDSGWAAVAPRRWLGVQTIPIESIVGTTDRYKAVAFDIRFRPPGWSRGRWTLLCSAALSGAQLPPISVYRVGAEHFVRDGHHRVSVMRAIGADDIEAEVTELRPAARELPAQQTQHP